MEEREDISLVTWTQIRLKNGEPFSFCEHNSLTAVSESQIALSGGQTQDKEYGIGGIKYTWIFDIPSMSWRKHTGPLPHEMCCVTATQGRGASVVIYEGTISGRASSDMVHIILNHSPKRLEDLVLQVILKYKHVLHKKNSQYAYKVISISVICNSTLKTQAGRIGERDNK